MIFLEFASDFWNLLVIFGAPGTNFWILLVIFEDLLVISGDLLVILGSKTGKNNIFTTVGPLLDHFGR